MDTNFAVPKSDLEMSEAENSFWNYFGFLKQKMNENQQSHQNYIIFVAIESFRSFYQLSNLSWDQFSFENLFRQEQIQFETINYSTIEEQDAKTNHKKKSKKSTTTTTTTTKQPSITPAQMFGGFSFSTLSFPSQNNNFEMNFDGWRFLDESESISSSSKKRKFTNTFTIAQVPIYLVHKFLSRHLQLL